MSAPHIEITWSCHICAAERPDYKIAVKSTDTSEEWNLPRGALIQNVRYCTDNPACITRAQTYRHRKYRR